VPATPRSASAASNIAGDLAVTKPAGLAVGDLMIAWHYADNDGSLAAMGAPTGWNLLGSDAGVSGGHPYVKVWTRVATSGDVAAATFTFTDSAASIFNSVAILAITAGTYDATTPTSAVTFQNGGTASSTSHTAPSMTGVVDGLLCTSHGSDTGGTAATYTPPSGMTEQADTNSGAGSYTALEVNTLALTSTAATGTKTATCTVSRPWKGSTLVVNPSGGGGGGGGAVAFRAASEDARGTTNAPIVTPPAGTIAGDLLLAFQVSDYRGSLAAMTAPADWVEVASDGSRSADVGFVKIWQKTATSSEPANYTFVDSTLATSVALIVALTGSDVTAAFAVNPTWNSGGAQTTHVASDVNGVATGMLLTAHIAGTNGTTRNYTSGPSGMTLAQDAFLSTSGYVTENVYYQALTATGPTGAKIATFSAAAPFVAVALVVQPPLPKTLLLSGIGTAEMFGSSTVTVDPLPQTVIPTGIASAEAFGSPTVAADPLPQTVSPTGIGTAETLGVPVVTVDLAAQTVNAVGLDTAEAFGTPTVTVAGAPSTGFGVGTFGTSAFGGSGVLVVSAVGIATAEAFGVPAVAGGLVILPGGMVSAEAFGSPTVSVPLVDVPGPYPGLTLFPGPDVFPATAALSPAAQTVTPAGIASAEAFGSPAATLANGDQPVVATAIDSAEAFGVPTVTAADPVFTISPVGIPSAEVFGDPGHMYVFVEVAPPVPTGSDTYFIDGVDLSGYAWRIETAEGLQVTPGVIGEDVVLPGRDGALEVYGGFGQPRRPDAVGQIVFSLWLKGVSSTTGLVPGGSTTAAEYFARWDELVRLFHRRRVTIDHVKADGSTRRAIAHLSPGDSIGPVRNPSSPWFGRFKATFAIPAAHWTDTAAVTTGQQSLATGGTLSLAAFAGATAVCTELTVTFGAGSNPRLSTSWGHVGWNNVIAAGRQLGIDTATGTTNSAAGTGWTPGYDALTFAPGPRLFEIDPSEALSAVLTHTGGGTMTVEVAGKRRYRTS
jgi:hypothetical protein